MNTTGMIVALLKQHLADEPQQDMGLHPSTGLQAEMGDRWAEWAKQKRAYETMLAPRLIREALEVPA